MPVHLSVGISGTFKTAEEADAVVAALKPVVDELRKTHKDLLAQANKTESVASSL